ncbi:hypothetical protein [Orrella sp. 11846]|uniref:hypothetical protein n=1 Tax=Orrella sp. 11846 TaxID=3409913 RepID=UPI003B59FFFB
MSSIPIDAVQLVLAEPAFVFDGSTRQVVRAWALFISAITAMFYVNKIQWHGVFHSENVST